ncbi:MAG TPA: hypothetical protein VFE47_23265 [Tepidisphaeraceae bacterium]|jgi:hypothetical protein|nr:hypothetical protein [Tepidisphaeraceae bacterium]
MSFPTNLRSSLKPSRQGALVVAGLLVFGLIILGGLYISPKAYPPGLPAGVPRGAAARTLRLVAYDLDRQQPTTDPMMAEIAKMKPDYLLLQGVNEDDSIEIAESLGMQQSFHPQLYQRSERLAGKKGIWGNLILSRQSLYEGAPLGGKRGGFGGWAVSVVDNHAFFVANLHLSPGDNAQKEAAEFQNIWKAAGSPPMVVAVLPSDAKPPVAALKFLTPAAGSNGEWLYVTKDWTIADSGTISTSGKGLVPRWIDIIKAGLPATTEPAKWK